MNVMLLTKLVAGLVALACGTDDFPFEEKDEIRKTLSFSDPAGPKRIEVDNINGAIKVDGYAGREVQLVVHQTFRGRSTEKIQEARKDVALEISQEKNAIRLYVEAPYRQRDGSVNYRGERYYGYVANFDFEIKVPHETSIDLKTINDGEIEVKGVTGDYDIQNVNGGIDMLDVGGSGRVYALNGEVRVLFQKNPPKSSYFGSLNGDVELTFLSNLSAIFRLKTFNGEVYADFPVTYVAGAKPIREQRKGKLVYRYDRTFGVQVGKGGPEIDLDAFNGDIHILKREK